MGAAERDGGMKYKPDWPDARERLTALWEGRPLDRPCMSVLAPSGKKWPRPPRPADPEQKWLDPEWVLADLRASMNNTWWGGEAIPSYLLMAGWVKCLGGTPYFDYHTIWFEHMEVDFSRPSPFRFRPDDPWVAKYERLYKAVAQEAGWDDFLVGRPGYLPANDLLSMHMGTQEFLMALVDHPEWMRKAIQDGAREQLRIMRRQQEGIAGAHAFWYGNAGWMPFWGPRPYIGVQSDVSCMMSPEMYDEFIVPELDIYAAEVPAVWYHLDGHDARQHLPRLLSLPYLRVVQYTPTPAEPPNGPEHLDFYRQVQQAGRIVHISLPKENVEPLARALDPGLLMLDVWCDTPDEGRELLAAARRWSAR
jgi:hypothetical protein